MRTYRHLSLEEREKLWALKEKGFSLRTIAKKLGRSHSSLARELKRNRVGPGKRTREYLTFKYLPCQAQKKAERRGEKQRYQAPLKEPLIFLYVREHLRLGWSPEQIAGRLSVDHPDKHISCEAIYQYVYSKAVKRQKLWQYLTNHRKKRMKKEGRKIKRTGKIPASISVDLRPKEVETRKTIGHWETDNVEGKRSDKTVLSVTVERLTRATLLNKLSDKSALSKKDALVEKLKLFPKKIRTTLTCDNGKENSYHQLVSKELGLKVYFCHAYHSWEKGTVENTNQRIRRHLPKGTSIDGITEEQIVFLEEKLNSTPRKCLGYLTPYEKMEEVLKKRI